MIERRRRDVLEEKHQGEASRGVRGADGGGGQMCNYS